jgi:hypothetical protein
MMDLHPPPPTSTYPFYSIGWRHILRRPGNIMVSEDVFHQRGIALLYRTFNVMIQCLFYGEFCILICGTHYSRLYVLRHLCVDSPDFHIYNDVSYLISLWMNQFNWPIKPKGPAHVEPENPVRRHSNHVFRVDCIPCCLDSKFNHHHQDLVSRCKSFRVNRHKEPHGHTSGYVQRLGPH